MEQFQAAARLLREADGLVVAAGAGMGVDSGLPDFRGPEGFWRAYPALGRAGIEFTEIASPGAFRRNPRLAWGFYGHRLALYRRTVPHAGFAILRRWGAQMERGVRVFTSNVDGHFQRAGFEGVYECHGSIHHLQCLRPCSQETWAAGAFEPLVDEEHCELVNGLPQCPGCGGLARPNILMFGDGGWLGERYDASDVVTWRRTLRRPVVVELGAGTAVPSVRMFAERAGGALIRINPREAAGGDVAIALGALEALRGIDALLA